MAGQVLDEGNTYQVHQFDPADPIRPVRGEPTDGWFQSSTTGTLDDYTDGGEAVAALNRISAAHPHLRFRVVRYHTTATLVAMREPRPLPERPRS